MWKFDTLHLVFIYVNLWNLNEWVKLKILTFCLGIPWDDDDSLSIVNKFVNCIGILKAQRRLVPNLIRISWRVSFSILSVCRLIDTDVNFVLVCSHVLTCVSKSRSSLASLCYAHCCNNFKSVQKFNIWTIQVFDCIVNFSLKLSE